MLLLQLQNKNNKEKKQEGVLLVRKGGGGPNGPVFSRVFSGHLARFSREKGKRKVQIRFLLVSHPFRLFRMHAVVNYCMEEESTHGSGEMEGGKAA